MKSPWDVVADAKAYTNKKSAQNKLAKVGTGNAIYLVNGKYHVAPDGDYRCKIQVA